MEYVIFYVWKSHYNIYLFRLIRSWSAAVLNFAEAVREKKAESEEDSFWLLHKKNLSLLLILLFDTAQSFFFIDRTKKQKKEIMTIKIFNLIDFYDCQSYWK